MKVITSYIDLSTSGTNEIIDITELVRANLKDTLLSEGSVSIFHAGSTAAITTIEYEPGLVADFKAFLSTIIPESGKYQHDARWNDGNGYAHIRSSFLKTSLTVPFSRSDLVLGTWQQIVFCEFDNRPRRRKIITQFIGE